MKRPRTNHDLPLSVRLIVMVPLTVLLFAAVTVELWHATVERVRKLVRR